MARAPGGETTVDFRAARGFLEPAANLTQSHRAMFYVGRSFANNPWVFAPASTTARDGLGPLFNARSCMTCHTLGGRAALPSTDGPITQPGLLIRLSVPGSHAELGVQPSAHYGSQLQTHAGGMARRSLDDRAPNRVGEALLHLTWQEKQGEFADGTIYSLRRPVFALADLLYGPIEDTILTSPRISPPLIGMGLLDAIPEAQLLENSDPEDQNGDGISGRTNRVFDVQTGETATGRFGWKAGQPNVEQQVAAAFQQDMGITSRLFPDESCTASQTKCLGAVSGGPPESDVEVQDQFLSAVVLFTSSLSPIRRDFADIKQVGQGARIFKEIGCIGCHVDTFTTGADAALPEFSNQTIHPYSDLLLHDMGEGLADARTEFLASGTEWRTPPLWSIGRSQQINPSASYLHDGRARNLSEAILWHGGEAAPSRRGFQSMPESRRDLLLAFLESL